MITPHRVPRSVLVLALALGLTGHALLAAADWPRFRGPNGLGVGEAKGLPTALSLPASVRWKIDVPPGHSSPVVSGKRLFLTAHEDDALLTLAFSTASGEILWRQEAPRLRQEKLDPRNDPASPSPVTDGSTVVVFFPDFGLLAYDSEGDERWRLPLGPFHNLYGMGASPILAEDVVILAADQHHDSFLLAVDIRTGAVRWRAERPEATSGHSTPVLYRPSADAGLQIVLPGSFFLTSYAAASGERLWWIRGLSFEMKSTPVIGDGVLYINGFGSEFNENGKERTVAPWTEVLPKGDLDGDGRLGPEEQPDQLARDWFVFNDLDADGVLSAEEWKYYQAALATKNSMMAIALAGADGRGDLTESHLRWRYHRSIPQLPSPLLYQGVLTMVNDRGIVTTFAPETGEVRAQGRLEGAVDSFYASPVAADGKVYLCGRSGKVVVLPADGTLNVKAVSDLDDEIYATPAIADEALFIRTRSRLYAFSGRP